MDTVITNISPDELKSYIKESIREVLDDYLEDILANSSNNYNLSVSEARKDYQSGKTLTLDELMDV
jgi:hypothetical protein